MANIGAIGARNGSISAQNSSLSVQEVRSLLSAIDNSEKPRLLADPHHLARIAAYALHWRRRQRSLFPPAVFRESCWDIMLLCFTSQLEGRPICVKQVGGQLAESHTALLRRIDELEEAGMLQRQRDALDGRRTMLRLTAAGTAAMTHFFELSEGLAD